MKRLASRLIDRRLLRAWPLPSLPEGGKEQRGTVLVVGGSREVPGGALLAGMAALRAGAGRVQVATAKSVAPQLAVAFPEARVLGLPETRQGELSTSKGPELRRLAQRCQALVLGPGMSDEAGASAILRDAEARHPDLPLVVDAAALRLLGDTKRSTRRSTLIATPHAGEMAEMWSCSRSEAEADPTALAERAARALGIVLVLKGACTIIAAPDGRIFRNEAGNAGLATSGSGDVLAGIIGGLAARGADAVQAAVWGVYLHAKAG
ncbi:MAG TPA: NAD(P)H-hydrate dehydratase, partial [Polyangiaceae bacterium]